LITETDLPQSHFRAFTARAASPAAARADLVREPGQVIPQILLHDLAVVLASYGYADPPRRISPYMDLGAGRAGYGPDAELIGG
jgi:hypothetical protein